MKLGKAVRVCTTLLCAFFVFGTRCTAQEPLVMAGKIVSAMKEANDALELLGELQGAASDVLTGKTPSMDTDWSQLADKYDRAAVDALAAPSSSSLVPTNNIVSVDQLSNCGTRQNAVAKVNAYLTDLVATQEKGQVAVSTLDTQLANVKKAWTALDYLTKHYEKLMALPLIGNRFALDWFDLHTRIPQSLSNLETAFSAQREKFAADLAILDTRIKNYRSNLDLVQTIPSCTTTMPNPPTGLLTTVS
jgi:hypothetical protein